MEVNEEYRIYKTSYTLKNIFDHEIIFIKKMAPRATPGSTEHIRIFMEKEHKVIMSRKHVEELIKDVNLELKKENVFSFIRCCSTLDVMKLYKEICLRAILSPGIDQGEMLISAFCGSYLKGYIIYARKDVTIQTNEEGKEVPCVGFWSYLELLLFANDPSFMIGYRNKISMGDINYLKEWEQNNEMAEKMKIVPDKWTYERIIISINGTDVEKYENSLPLCSKVNGVECNVIVLATLTHVRNADSKGPLLADVKWNIQKRLIPEKYRDMKVMEEEDINDCFMMIRHIYSLDFVDIDHVNQDVEKTIGEKYEIRAIKHFKF